MARTIKTKLDAAHEWVREFNAIQQGIIERLMRDNPEEWTEVTAPSVGDRVYVYDVPDGYSHEGKIHNYNMESDIYFIEPEEGEVLSVERDDFEVERYDGLPMWSTMWSFGDSVDDYWLEEMNGIQIMSDCGFRIYQHEEYGFFFGIDGCGYDFYSQHWLPLYNARGLEWHGSGTEEQSND